ncbi:NDR1/HIN1-like protein 1 [Phragmites australis]|uniref:NDR1/HIN1-like protein 1 n=1 Tax=Phragmites australis TaxID=29695 RepID=UPI002D76BBE7|nr:NDR1/HIN1-like protein 1 [Phragmites australis]
MADHQRHHLSPEPADFDHHHNHEDGKSVHADDLKPASRGRRYNYGGGEHHPLRAVCFAVLVLLLAAGITALVLYVVYCPGHPSLAVTSAAVLSIYNATLGAAAGGAVAGPAPTALAASFQFTLVIRNPSGRSAARYDRLTAYVAYRGEAITAPTAMPPLVQDAGSAVAVAPVLGGGVAAPVPVSPDTAAALAMDVSFGVLALRVVVLGRVRFVSGPFRRGWHSLYARCDLLVGVRKLGNGGGAAGPLLGNPVCNVDV